MISKRLRDFNHQYHQLLLSEPLWNRDRNQLIQAKCILDQNVWKSSYFVLLWQLLCLSITRYFLMKGNITNVVCTCYSSMRYREQSAICKGHGCSRWEVEANSRTAVPNDRYVIPPWAGPYLGLRLQTRWVRYNLYMCVIHSENIMFMSCLRFKYKWKS